MLCVCGRHVVEAGQLVVLEAEKVDEGSYTCTATNEAATRTSHRATLSVYGRLLVIFFFLRP